MLMRDVLPRFLLRDDLPLPRIETDDASPPMTNADPSHLVNLSRRRASRVYSRPISIAHYELIYRSHFVGLWCFLNSPSQYTSFHRSIMGFVRMFGVGHPPECQAGRGYRSSHSCSRPQGALPLDGEAQSPREAV